MFDLVPFGKQRRDDWFHQVAKSFSDVFEDDFFAPMKGSSLPFRTDIHEEDDHYRIEAELPGFRKEEIDIDYAAPYLTIKAVRNEEAKADGKDGKVVRRERRYGEYVRRFYVQDIEDDGIRARLQDGVLTLTAPKRQRPEGRRISIEDGGN